MTKPTLPKEFVKHCKKVTAKRARTVIDHILKHGHITTEELKTKYGYDHPPRAARDVREEGIPLVTTRVQGSTGRNIGAYAFGDPSKVRFGRAGGRTAFSKNLKAQLIEMDGARCAIYLEDFPERDLQIDHRIPFEVAGDAARIKTQRTTCSSVDRQIGQSLGPANTVRTGLNRRMRRSAVTAIGRTPTITRTLPCGLRDE